MQDSPEFHISPVGFRSCRCYRSKNARLPSAELKDMRGSQVKEKKGEVLHGHRPQLDLVPEKKKTSIQNAQKHPRQKLSTFMFVFSKKLRIHAVCSQYLCTKVIYTT